MSKTSKRRPCSVSREQYERNRDRIYGKQTKQKKTKTAGKGA